MLLEFFYFCDLIVMLIFIFLFWTNHMNLTNSLFKFSFGTVGGMLDCNKNVPNSSFFSYFLFYLCFSLCLFGYFSYSMSVFGFVQFTFLFALLFWLSSFFLFISTEDFSVYLTKSGDSFLKSASMMLIELVSEFSRPLSLTVRLTVNIMVGHMLIMTIYMFSSSVDSYFYIPMITFSILMEFFVFLIQSYIFSRLIFLYVGE